MILTPLRPSRLSFVDLPKIDSAGMSLMATNRALSTSPMLKLPVGDVKHSKSNHVFLPSIHWTCTPLKLHTSITLPTRPRIPALAHETRQTFPGCQPKHEAPRAEHAPHMPYD